MNLGCHQSTWVHPSGSFCRYRHGGGWRGSGCSWDQRDGDECQGKRTDDPVSVCAWGCVYTVQRGMGACAYMYVCSSTCLCKCVCGTWTLHQMWKLEYHLQVRIQNNSKWQTSLWSCHTTTSVAHIKNLKSQYLEHFVGRWLNSRWHVGWLKHNLLYLGEVVLGIAVENHLTNGHQRVVTMGPDLRALAEKGREGKWRGMGKCERDREEEKKNKRKASFQYYHA